MLTLNNFYYPLMNLKQIKEVKKKRKIFELATLGFEKKRISEQTYNKYKILFNKSRKYNYLSWNFGESENEFNVNSSRRKKFQYVLDKMYTEIKKEAKKLNLKLSSGSFGSFEFVTPNNRYVSMFYDGE